MPVPAVEKVAPLLVDRNASVQGTGGAGGVVLQYPLLQ